VTKAGIREMNQDFGPEDIRLNMSNQKGLWSFGFDRGRCGHPLVTLTLPEQNA